MADPYNSNISAQDAKRFDATMPPGKGRLDLATRLRQARIDMDSLVAGVTNASIKTALATGGDDLDLGGSDAINIGNLTAGQVLGTTAIGSLGGLGVHGQAPAAQAAKIADPTDLPTAITAVAAIIDVLEAVGFSSAT